MASAASARTRVVAALSKYIIFSNRYSSLEFAGFRANSLLEFAGFRANSLIPRLIPSKGRIKIFQFAPKKFASHYRVTEVCIALSFEPHDNASIHANFVQAIMLRTKQTSEPREHADA
jgi:hypothetical protein